MQPAEQVVELAVGIVLAQRPGRESAAKRRGDAGLVGQAFDMDDTPFHVSLARRLQFSFAGHVTVQRSQGPRVSPFAANRAENVA